MYVRQIRSILDCIGYIDGFSSAKPCKLGSRCLLLPSVQLAFPGIKDSFPGVKVALPCGVLCFGIQGGFPLVKGGFPGVKLFFPLVKQGFSRRVGAFPTTGTTSRKGQGSNANQGSRAEDLNEA